MGGRRSERGKAEDTRTRGDKQHSFRTIREGGGGQKRGAEGGRRGERRGTGKQDGGEK